MLSNKFPLSTVSDVERFMGQLFNSLVETSEYTVVSGMGAGLHYEGGKPQPMLCVPASAEYRLMQFQADVQSLCDFVRSELEAGDA